MQRRSLFCALLLCAPFRCSAQVVTGDILGTITISIGVAQLAEGETVADLIQRADACLYKAKHSGRNCVIGENDPRLAKVETNAA